jgi:lipopolysaccharide/colanic/teichoic acid biosynthesis glycosyltransferase
MEMFFSSTTRCYLFLKRLFDVSLSCIILFLISPMLVFVAALIKITSLGSVFYQWKVVGKDGRYFTGYKFRSMYDNADEIKERLVSQNEMAGPVFKLTNDPRVTPVGRILRKVSLDELPQLWSVIKGDMSLVGPRPPLQSEYEQFSDWQKQKLKVKPGITCLWQTRGRNEIKDFNEWVKLDLEYIEKRNFWFDMKILLDTMKCVVKGTGK